MTTPPCKSRPPLYERHACSAALECTADANACAFFCTNSRTLIGPYASQPFDIIAEPIVPVVLMVIRRADIDVAVAQFEEIDVPVCTENLNRVNEVKESPNGELLKLGVEVAQSSVAKYMAKRRGPPSQGWRTLLRNHAPDIAAMDLFVVPTIGFDLLYALVIIRLDRRDLVWINVTTNPTAEWITRQITEAFPCHDAPKYLIRDRDQIYGAS